MRVLYVSPLKALAYDIERNLRAPLDGHPRARRESAAASAARLAARRVRTGDTPPRERRAQSARAGRHPRHDARVALPDPRLARSARRSRSVETVIVDEIHALAPTKRGAHLALSLERLGGADRARSAAHRALGHRAPARRGRALSSAATGPVAIVDASEPPGPRPRDRVPCRRPDLDGEARSAAARLAGHRTLLERDPRAPLARSSSPTAAACASGWRAPAERAGAARSSCARTTAASRTSAAREIEEALKAGALRGDRRDQLARAGHRHGRGRPRAARRVAGRRRARPAARRPRRAPRRRGAAAGASIRAPRRPARGGGAGARHAARRASSRSRVPRNALDVLAQQIVAHRERGADRAWRRSRRCCAAATATASSRASAARRCSTCWRAATRRPTSPSCAPRCAGTAQRTGSRRCRGAPHAGAGLRRHDPRPRPLRGAPRRRRARASASSTRSWSTRRGPARS